MIPAKVYTRGPISNVGIGLRALHQSEIVATRPAIPWFEVLTDNFLAPGGMPLKVLEDIRQHYPIVMHSVGLSIGSTDPLDLNYLKQLKAFRDRFQPSWISEHLCWTSVHGKHFHDLMPLPYTPEVVKHVVDRIDQVQNFFGERLLIENVSSYLNFKDSTLSEWEFVRSVAESADCYLLCDLNNIYVSAVNHDFSPLTYLDGLPVSRIKQFHLAGFEDHGNYLLDAHNQAVADPVWELYVDALKRFGPVPTLIEWDAEIPPLQRLMAEMHKAQGMLSTICHEAA